MITYELTIWGKMGICDYCDRVRLPAPGLYEAKVVAEKAWDAHTKEGRTPMRMTLKPAKNQSQPDRVSPT